LQMDDGLNPCVPFEGQKRLFPQRACRVANVSL
jgi:hypothetical protein